MGRKPNKRKDRDESRISYEDFEPRNQKARRERDEAAKLKARNEYRKKNNLPPL